MRIRGYLILPLGITGWAQINYNVPGLPNGSIDGLPGSGVEIFHEI